MIKVYCADLEDSWVDLKDITEDFQFMKFPCGESHIKMNNYYNVVNTNYITILFDFDNNDEIMLLALLKNLLDQIIHNENKNVCIDLQVGYFPYGRQDRTTFPSQPFSLKVVCQFINSMKFTNIMVADPHSDVTLALLDNVSTMLVDGYDGIIDKNSVLISPDAGAFKKTEKVRQVLALEHEIVIASKMRDVATGEITGTKIYGNVADQDCVILDDICDGGRTFIEIAKVLKREGAKSVKLFVTHGKFTKGTKVLFDSGIDEIYHYNVFTKRWIQVERSVDEQRQLELFS